MTVSTSLRVYWRNVYVLFYLFVVFQVLDWVSTVMFLSAGLATEGNPFARYLFSFNIWLPLFAKFVVCAIVFVTFYCVWIRKYNPKAWMPRLEFWWHSHKFRIVKNMYAFLIFMGVFVVLHNFSMFFSY